MSHRWLNWKRIFLDSFVFRLLRNFTNKFMIDHTYHWIVNFQQLLARLGPYLGLYQIEYILKIRSQKDWQPLLNTKDQRLSTRLTLKPLKRIRHHRRNLATQTMGPDDREVLMEKIVAFAGIAAPGGKMTLNSTLI